MLFVGRVMNKRSAGSKLFFYDIRSGETVLQVMSSLGMYESESADQSPEDVFHYLIRLLFRKSPCLRNCTSSSILAMSLVFEVFPVVPTWES